MKNFTKYNMHYIIYRIVKKYGHNIEQFDTIRAIVDFQFYHQSEKLFKTRFLFFMLFFVMPFMIQLFS